MKRIGLQAALVVIVASIAPAVAWGGDAGVRNCTWCRGTSATIRPKLANDVNSARAHAEDEAAVPVSAQELKAKTEYCKTCHGIEGRDFAERSRCRGWRDSSLNISRINCRRLSSAGERTL